jgi:hypothetical protein
VKNEKKEFNLKKLDGVFGYSVFSGFMLSILIFTGADVSETGILLTVLESVANNLGSPSPYLVPGIVILVTIMEIIVIIFSIKQISEHGYAGIIVSSMGFFGSILLFISSMSNTQIAMYTGILMLIVGIFVARIGK